MPTHKYVGYGIYVFAHSIRTIFTSQRAEEKIDIEDGCDAMLYYMYSYVACIGNAFFTFDHVQLCHIAGYSMYE